MIERERVTYEKYESQGYDVIKAGAPDLILLKDGVISFVEVKSKIDKLSEDQERAHKLLLKHGFNTEIEIVTITPKNKGPPPSIFDSMTPRDKNVLKAYLELPHSEWAKYTCGGDFEERGYKQSDSI